MPLHAEGIARGGNDIKIIFAGQSLSLHFIWDVSILQKHTNSNESNELQAAELWADELFDRPAMHELYRTQLYEGMQISGFEEIDVLDPKSFLMAWAGEANAWVCSYILAEGRSNIEGKELSGAYFEGAVPIVDGLVAKSGRRLALWINAMAKAV